MNPAQMLAVMDSDVIRFHAHRDPYLRGSISTHQHQWQAVSWYLMLCKDPQIETLRALQWHDVPEMVTGDNPGPAKQASGDLSAALAYLEAHVMSELDLPVITDPKQVAWCKLCDRLADYWHVASRCAYQLDEEDWQEARAEIGGIAQGLGIGALVETVLMEVDG